MKRISFFLLFTLLIIGCDKKEKLTFEPVEFTQGSCTDCPSIVIKIPKALDELKVAQNINTSIREEIIYALSFEESGGASTIEEAIDVFSSEYQRMKKEFPEMTNFSEWEAQITTNIAFEDKDIITLEMNTYTFTGGAHGYSYTTYLNFDKRSGSEIENSQLFSDLEGFVNMAESKFRVQEEIPKKAAINDTGFMFNANQYELADNIGFTKKGLQMVYNQYEVASYADGPIILTLSYTETNPFLKKDFQIKE